MKNRALIALVALAGSAVAASGQENIVYTFTIDTPIIGAVGGSTGVHLIATLVPPVGTPTFWNTPPGTGQPGTVGGFASFIGGVSTTSGTWSNPMVNGLNLGVAPAGFNQNGTPSGSAVNGIECAQFAPPFPNFNSSNSIEIWSGTWTSAAAGVFNFASSITGGTQIFINLPQLGYVGENVPGTNAAGIVTVVPAPASLALLGLGGLIAGRRRR